MSHILIQLLIPVSYAQITRKIQFFDSLIIIIFLSKSNEADKNSTVEMEQQAMQLWVGAMHIPLVPTEY